MIFSRASLVATAPAAILSVVGSIMLAVLVTSCTSAGQSTRTSGDCSGGNAVVTLSNIAASNVNSSTFRTARVMAQSSAVRSGYVFVASVCPTEAASDRTITFALGEPLKVGATYTLTAATVDGANYLDYTELAIDPKTNTMTSMKTWMASGTITVESLDGVRVEFSANNLVMNKRPGQGSNGATGSFAMDVRMRVDNINESSVTF